MTPEEAQHWFHNTRILTKQKQHRETLAEIINQTNFLSENSSMPQRLWHIINQTNEIPKCKTCGKQVNWDRRYKKYKTFCGNPRCSNTDPDIRSRKLALIDFEAAKLKRQQTNLKRYGHTNYLASLCGLTDAMKGWEKTKQRTQAEKEKIKQRRIETIKQKHGVENYSHKYLSSTALQNLTTQTIIGTPCGEKQVLQYIQSLGVSVIQKDRTTIEPYELDIYIPSHKLAIEYCGLYWHSEQQGKTRSYHKNKHELCAKMGIRLITIFEDEWVLKQEQVKRKLALLLNCSNEPVIYARNCKIIENISSQEKKIFFDKNHIQGDGSGSITLGLKHENKIVAMMTWKQISPDIWLLNRYATSCRVPGGFSKLLTYFKQSFSWKRLISFADLRWSNGDVYKKTGWIHESTIPPDYYYSLDGHYRIHKFNFRRKNLPKLLKNFNPELSETQNCILNGVLRIWDCGKMRFVINKQF